MIKKLSLYTSILFCLILNIVIDLNIYKYFLVLEKCFNINIDNGSSLYLFICFIFAIISFLIIIDVILVVRNKKSENKGIKFKNEDGTYGTANWMNENEMQEVLSFDKPGIILGKHNNKIIRLPFDSYFNKNICVFGSSGSMKTIGFLLTNLLELSIYKKSIIVTDPKRRNIQKNIQLF